MTSGFPGPSFATANKAAVAGYCGDNLIARSWTGDGMLRTVHRRSAIISHPRTGEELWFNHLVFWSEWSLDPEVRAIMTEDLGRENLPFSTAFGDGEPVGKDDIETIDAAYREATVRESWRPGGLLIVGNLGCCSAPARKILIDGRQRARIS